MFVVHCVIVCSNVLHSTTFGPPCFVFHSHIQDNQGLTVHHCQLYRLIPPWLKNVCAQSCECFVRTATTVLHLQP